MPRSFLRHCALATLIVLPAAYASEPPATSPPDAAPTAAAAVPERKRAPVVSVLKAGVNAAEEIQSALEASDHLGHNLDTLVGFRHTPQTAQLLADAIGNPQPWRLERGATVKGQSAYRFMLEAVRHRLADGSTVHWRALPIDLKVDGSGRKVTFRGAWPVLGFDSKALRATLRGMRMHGDQRLGQGDIWYGKMEGTLKQVELAGRRKGEPASVALHNLRFVSQVDERPTMIDIAQRFQAARIAADGEQMNNLTVAYRIVNLDKQSAIEMVAMERKLRSLDQGTQDASKDLAAMMDIMGRLVRSAAKSNTALVFDRVSAGYAGHAFSLSGRIGFKGVQDSDGGQLMQLMQRLDARFELALPVALVKAVNLSIVKREARSAGEKPSAAENNKLAQAMTDVFVDKLKKGGYVRLERGVLRSSVVLSEGKLTVNGKPAPLPLPTGPGKPDPTPDQVPGPLRTAPPRQIPGTCMMPDFPDDVVDEDAESTLTVEVLVDESGKPFGNVISTASDDAGYDARVLTALADCRYTPALEDGDPVVHQLTVTITREPGSVRPSVVPLSDRLER